MRFFVDTNVLIYTRDPTDPAKQDAATRWLLELARRDIAVVNLQVLNELCHVVLRKLPHLGVDALQEWVAELRPWGDTVVDAEITDAAWPIHVAFGYSWFDCLLLAAADRLGCTHFLSEDMGHGVRVESVAIVDPFRLAPTEMLSH
jgi:predicted nucleic acid-binding protein